jgi:hypothetical protein
MSSILNRRWPVSPIRQLGNRPEVTYRRNVLSDTFKNIAASFAFSGGCLVCVPRNAEPLDSVQPLD